MDFVVMVVLQDGDGNRVVAFHLQESGLVAGGDILHLRGSHSYRVCRELGS